MTAPTHVAFAEFLYLLILTSTGIALSLPNVLVVGLASLLPDIDTGASVAGRALPAISRAVERRFGHRTATHSAVGIASLGVLLLPMIFWDRDVYACFLAGYASHPFLDTMTINGVQFLYPFSTLRCVFPVDVNHPFRYRARTGSKVDRILGFVFLLGCIPTFFVAHEGYERFVRYAQRNIESAVRDYNEFSRSALVYADISAHNLLTKQTLSGSYEVVGTLNNHTLLFRGADGRLHSLGNEYQAEYVAESALCMMGEPVDVLIRRIDMHARPLGAIATASASAGETLFFGEVHVHGHVNLPEEGVVFSPITGSGGAIRLSYASAADVKALALDPVFVDEGVLTARTLVTRRPGRDSAGLAIRGLGEYALESFACDPKDSLRLLRREGDSVSPGEILAMWGHALAEESKLELLRARMATLSEETAARLAEVRESIRKSEAQVSADSVALRAMSELGSGGFVPPGVVGRAEEKFRRSIGILEKARRSEWLIRAKTALASKKLRLELEVLAHPGHAEGDRGVCRSSVSGRIESIREEPQGGKRGVSIVIRKSP